MKLGEWLHSQRRIHRISGLPDERWHTLDDEAPGWEGAVNTWQLKLDMLVEFISDHHRYPRQSESAGQHERILGNWLGRQRTAIRAGELRESRLAALDERSPGWDNCAGTIGRLAA